MRPHNALRPLQVATHTRPHLPSSSPSPWLHQTRSSTAHGPATIPVRLLKHLDTYGKQGSIVPIPAGQMRNKFFPARLATYLSPTERKSVLSAPHPPERDTLFSRYAFHMRERAAAKQARKALVEEAQDKLVEKLIIAEVAPDRAIGLLQALLPAHLDFPRAPVDAVPDAPASANVPATAAASSSGPIPIYGSVSAGDVVAVVKAAVVHNEEAARIPLTSRDVRFLGVAGGDDLKHLKHLGEYDVEISVRGAGEVVRRVVRVVPRAVVVEA
ncbi:hypothetical protein EJ06DRAFT_551860 [Trichodelitschia bisporula]|uniref:Ribosomal protein L9 domain-containing protein n=1 Tax=Trichodelitschia bisporula TaxID=703511 RepID=A0A6G1HJY0_9PEZI|nr:hypothetical protein EJ06DRAFT_551860 [Trichodelitschia bisporula]